MISLQQFDIFLSWLDVCTISYSCSMLGKTSCRLDFEQANMNRRDATSTNTCWLRLIRLCKLLWHQQIHVSLWEIWKFCDWIKQTPNTHLKWNQFYVKVLFTVSTSKLNLKRLSVVYSITLSRFCVCFEDTKLSCFKQKKIVWSLKWLQWTYLRFDVNFLNCNEFSFLFVEFGKMKFFFQINLPPWLGDPYPPWLCPPWLCP